jgi:hypothetical protein
MISKFQVRGACFIAHRRRGRCPLGIEPRKIIFPIQLRHCPAPTWTTLLAAGKVNVYNSLGRASNK